MTKAELYEKYALKLGRPITAGEVVYDIKQLDAVDVVRCEDCVNAQYDCMVRRITGNGETLKVYWCDGREVLGDDFCSRGERREDGCTD